MYFLRKTFELAICLFGYWLGRRFGGWGGGILLAFAGLVASSWGWEWLARNVFMRDGRGDARMHFIYGVISSIMVAGAAYVLWGK
ncbi:MAG: hypothetical protein KDK89_19195 [Alphaproteobacteria bacterium]|nr:hypothetical protein [Alphaproteobacteria bacterium]